MAQDRGRVDGGYRRTENGRYDWTPQTVDKRGMEYTPLHGQYQKDQGTHLPNFKESTGSEYGTVSVQPTTCKPRYHSAGLQPVQMWALYLTISTKSIKSVYDRLQRDRSGAFIQQVNV